jgi:hypothetical protein
VRPLKSSDSMIQVHDHQLIAGHPDSTEQHLFAYDFVFDSHRDLFSPTLTNQQRIFEEIG